MRLDSKLVKRLLYGRPDGGARVLRTTEQHLALVRVGNLYNRHDETRFTVTGTVWD